MDVGDEPRDHSGSSTYNEPYNELLSRVDATVLGEPRPGESTRSAYGGDHSASGVGREASSDAECGGERTVHCHAYVLWGAENELPRPIQLWLVGLFVGVVAVLSLEIDGELSWIAAWLVTTALAHAAVAATRGAIVNFDPELTQWRSPVGFVCAVCALWVVIKLAVDGLSRASFRIFLATTTLGVILVEAAYRVGVARCEKIPGHWANHPSWAAASPRDTNDQYYNPL